MPPLRSGARISVRADFVTRGEGRLRSAAAPHIPPLDLSQPDSAMQASLRQNAQVSSHRYSASRSLLTSIQCSMRRLIVTGTVTLSLLLVGLTYGQPKEQTSYDVPLRLNTESKSGIGWNVELRSVEGKSTFRGDLPGRYTVQAEINERVLSARIQPGSNSTQRGEARLDLPMDSTKQVSLYRPVLKHAVPYAVTYRVDTTDQGEIQRSLFWQSHYRAQGTLRVDTCQATIAFSDLNGDGQFSHTDFQVGTSLQIDRNDDGKMYGRDEYLMGTQIIQFCGRDLLIGKLHEDGSSVEFVRANADVPQVGQSAPDFQLTTTGDETITTETLQDQAYLLDFWASWCAPCVAKLPKVDALSDSIGGGLQTIAVNVDDKEDVGQARKTVERLDLSMPVVLRGQGDDDPLWRQYGSMMDVRMSIPMYVLVDQEGKVRYAGRGGEELRKLRHAVKEVIGPDGMNE